MLGNSIANLAAADLQLRRHDFVPRRARAVPQTQEQFGYDASEEAELERELDREAEAAQRDKYEAWADDVYDKRREDRLTEQEME